MGRIKWEKRLIERILASAARQHPLPETKRTLEKSLNGFTSWESLFDQAHHHGVTALLWHNIKKTEVSIPARQRQLFKLQAFRYRRINQVRLEELSELLRIFAREGIEAIVLKGCALALLVYDDIGLRPMRDIDLLLKKSDLVRAQDVMSSNGFRAEIPQSLLQDHHHIVPFVKEIKGFTIQLELHHRLLPILPQYPKFEFSEVSKHVTHFDCAGVDALSMDFELMLWYIFIHGFRMPLWYEPYRLMHLADIISLIEKRFNEIDWERLIRIHPEMPSSLAVLHQLCPFADKVRLQLGLSDYGKIKGIGREYLGWPRRRFIPSKIAAYPQLIMATLFPAPWWLRLYYSDKRKRSLLNHWVRHIGNVGRQVVLISRLVRISNTQLPK